MKLTALAESRWQLDKAQAFLPEERTWGALQVLCAALSAAGVSPSPAVLWPLWMCSTGTRVRPLVTYKTSHIKEDSDVPVWLRAQLWESIPDPHYANVTISVASDDDEDLQLLIRPLSIDMRGLGWSTLLYNHLP